MKKFSLFVMLTLVLTSLSCSVLGLSLGATPTPENTATPTLTATPVHTPTPTQTPTPEATPTPEILQINFDVAKYQIAIPGSYVPSDFSTQYDNGAVMITGEGGDFNMIVANFPSTQFAPGTLATILIMIFESEFGLKVDRQGMEFATTGLIDAELNGMSGEGWGFTGVYEGNAVEGEVLGFKRDEANSFLTFAFINTEESRTWADDGKAIFEDILKSLSFTK